MQHILFAALILHTRKLGGHVLLYASHHHNSICSAHKRKESIVINPRTRTTSLFHTAQKTSKHVPNWKDFWLNMSILRYIRVSRWPSLSEASSLSMNDTLNEGKRETETPGGLHTELTSKNEVWSEFPKPAFSLSLSVDVTVIQEASVTTLIRALYTCEVLIPLTFILPVWL